MGEEARNAASGLVGVQLALASRVQTKMPRAVLTCVWTRTRARVHLVIHCPRAIEEVPMTDVRISRSTTALILNDMINGTLRCGDAGRDDAILASGIIGRSAEMVDNMRSLRVPVIWIRIERRADRADVASNVVDRYPRGYRLPPWTAGSMESRNVDELPVRGDDQVVLKPRMDPFVGTDLDLQLRTRRIQTILLGGYSTNGGVESCARSAYCLGYDVVILSDCSYNVEEELHEFALLRILPWYGRVRTCSDVISLLDE